MDIAQAVDLLPIILLVFSHLVALFGTPAVIASIKPLSAVVDFATANYGKATNKVK